jgi:tRNA-specific 2-thiouridylase
MQTLSPMVTADPPGTPVIVGISGGVDSAAAALLLQRAGYHVRGLFMKNRESCKYCDYYQTKYCT